MPEFDLLSSGKIDLYKTAIKNAVETYPLEWRVIFETLQNSIDAITKNDRINEGNIDIIFNLDNDSVIIKDDGLGFPLKEDLFFLNGGTKVNDKKSKGKIGVGLKVTIFSSNYFYINSVFESDGTKKSWTAEIKDAYKYTEKSALNVTTTGLQETNISTGTIINYSFPDKSVLNFIKTASSQLNDISDKIERNLGQKFIKSIEHFFRLYGYAADTLNLINNNFSKKININITIEYKSIPVGLEQNITSVLKDFNGEINFSFNNKYWDIEELIRKQTGINKPKIISHKFYENLTDYGRFNPDTHVWIRSFSDKKEIKELLPKKSKDKYDSLIEKINGIYLALGNISNMRKFFFQVPEQFISINGIPSDHKLPKPTSNTFYSNLVLCIIDVDSTLNYGKLQTTNRHLIHNCGEFYLDIYKNAIKKIGERTVGYDTEEDTSSMTVEKPIEITSLEDLKIDSSIKKIPVDENTLIALFFDLLGRGIIKDYKFYSLHAKRTYDATAMIKTPNMSSIPNPSNDSDLKFIEFKLRLSELLDDIENKEKELKKMSLIIVWEDDISGSAVKPEEYEIITLEDSKDKDSGFYGVKKCLVNRLDGTERQVFVMKEFLENLTHTSQKAS